MADLELRRKLCLAAGWTWCRQHQAPRYQGKWTCLAKHRKSAHSDGDGAGGSMEP